VIENQHIVGCCGWTEAQAKYVRSFDAIELQTTFYQPPANPVAQRWKATAPVNFKFRMKAWQLITHPGGGSERTGEGSKTTSARERTPSGSGVGRRFEDHSRSLPTPEFLCSINDYVSRRLGSAVSIVLGELPLTATAAEPGTSPPFQTGAS
jgi:hypothetical protein